MIRNVMRKLKEMGAPRDKLADKPSFEARLKMEKTAQEEVGARLEALEVIAKNQGRIKK